MLPIDNPKSSPLNFHKSPHEEVFKMFDGGGSIRFLKLLVIDASKFPNFWYLGQYISIKNGKSKKNQLMLFNVLW